MSICTRCQFQGYCKFDNCSFSQITLIALSAIAFHPQKDSIAVAGSNQWHYSIATDLDGLANFIFSISTNMAKETKELAFSPDGRWLASSNNSSFDDILPYYHSREEVQSKFGIHGLQIQESSSRYIFKLTGQQIKFGSI